jgi:hypothetical protein
MERVYTDTIGPLVLDKFGNLHIIVMIDAYTRWIELYAVPDTTAVTAARVALLDWVGRFGVPLQLMSDQGTQFTNELWDELSILMGTVKLESFPYSHEENGLVERANKEVMRHLRNILFDQKLQYSEWSIYLPLVKRIMNGHPVGATGVTPAQLLFGNAVSLNDRILATPRGHVESRPLSKVTSDMIAMQEHLIRLHTEALKKADERHLATPYDKRGKHDHFPPGSYVLVEYSDSTLKGRGPPHKLMPFLRGPYRVVSNVGTRYTVLDLLTNKYEDVLIHKLHPFAYDEGSLDPMDVAGRDREEYKVQEILGHRGDPKLKSTLEFKVRWEGYDESYDTWEPWKQLRLVDKLHAYLKDNGMAGLIPMDCRGEQTPEPSRHTKKRVRFDERSNSILRFDDSGEGESPRRSSRLSEQSSSSNSKR